MENHDHSTSGAQRQANQQNAQHSTGPRTEAGKARSKLNATRHSLTGQVHITTEEDRIAYDAHCKAYFAEWNPPTTTQTHLVQTLADKQWQIHHSAAILQSIYIQGQAELADKIDTDHPQVHDALAAGLFTWNGPKRSSSSAATPRACNAIFGAPCMSCKPCEPITPSVRSG